MLYAFFWVIPGRQNFVRQDFKTLFHNHRQVHLQRKVILHTYPPIKLEQCSETSAYKIQKPGNYPKESVQQSEDGESLKSL